LYQKAVARQLTLVAYLLSSDGRAKDETSIQENLPPYVDDRTRGRNITSERAGGVIAPVAERFKLPYTFGNWLRYSGQYVLLAAVALGRATVTKEGRSDVYSIKG